MKKLICIVSVVVFPLFANAQRNTDTTVFEYQTKGQLPIANSLKVPENPVYLDTAKMAPEMKYAIVSRPVSPPVVLLPMKAAKMEGEPLKKLYHSGIRAGMGTYTTPLLDLRYNQLRSKTSSFGVHLKHHSSAARLKDHGYAGWSDDLLEGNLKYFLRRHTLSPFLRYERNGMHYYGYDTSKFILEKDFTKQVFHRLDLGVALQSHYSDSGKLNHRISFDLRGMQDRFDVRESNLLFKAELGKEYKGHHFGGIIRVDHLGDSQDFIDTSRNTIISLDPYVKFIGKKFRAQLGVAITSELGARNKFRIYPTMYVQYGIAGHILVPYAGAGGGLYRISYASLTKDNPFLAPSAAFQLRNRNERFELFGGIRGTLSSAVSYDLKAGYKLIQDQHFYVTDTLEGSPDLFELLENRFKLAYDTISHFRFSGVLRFRKADKFSFLLKGEYNLYSMRAEAYPWYSPAIRLDAMFRYNLREKIILDLDVFYRSRQLAPVHKDSSHPDGVKELAGYADVNLLLEYRYNTRLSFFLNTYNLGSGRYYRWNNYPSQRLVLMGGLTFSF